MTNPCTKTARVTRSYFGQLTAAALALSLLLLQVQKSSSADGRNEEAVEQYRGVAWCRSPTATKSEGQRVLVDSAFEWRLQRLAETA